MLWHKSWLETRSRLVLALVTAGLFLLSTYANGVASQGAVRVFVGSEWLVLAIAAAMVSGAGVVTQAPPRTSRGIHGSILYTLSMPVSRSRLLSTRAAMGWIALAGLTLAMTSGAWALFPPMRESVTPFELLVHTLTLFACATSLYSIPVLLATFLDDQWRLWASMAIIAFLRWLSVKASLPNSIDIFRAMGDNSPLLAHRIPWSAMACSWALGTILFVAALKIVQRREY